MSTYYAVLFDVVSIQKYVFSSNELVDNLGASHIVKNLFDALAVPVFAHVFGITEEEVKKIINLWKREPQLVLMDKNLEVPFEIGMADGGKALIFFRDKMPGKKFIKKFTRKLLIEAPGIQLAVADKENFRITEGSFKNDLNDLFNQLMINRNRFFPATILPNHGITTIYSQSGTSINIKWPRCETGQYIPAEKAFKLIYADEEKKELQEELENRYPGFCFTDEVDKLGQTEGDNYTAVVHIDGNGIGNWFQQSATLIEYRQRSNDMRRITEESFWKLVEETTEIIKKLEQMEETPGFSIKEEKGKKVLFIRPIILGGDDVTFICHGKLALYLAEKFIRIWTSKANDKEHGLVRYGLPANNEFTACAGIAIAKTKYPFYRVYQMSVQSCSMAKHKAREKNGSWIDYHILMGSESGDLTSIRNDKSKTFDYSLYYGPYSLDDQETDCCKSLKSLKQGIKEFQFDNYWARSNLNSLRMAFNLGKEAVDSFLTHMEAKGGKLPYRHGWRQAYKDCSTPYYDMLEMIEFYPLWLLEGGQ